MLPALANGTHHLSLRWPITIWLFLKPFICQSENRDRNCYGRLAMVKISLCKTDTYSIATLGLCLMMWGSRGCYVGWWFIICCKVWSWLIAFASGRSSWLMFRHSLWSSDLAANHGKNSESTNILSNHLIFLMVVHISFWCVMVTNWCWG